MLPGRQSKNAIKNPQYNTSLLVLAFTFAIRVAIQIPGKKDKITAKIIMLAVFSLTQSFGICMLFCFCGSNVFKTKKYL